MHNYIAHPDPGPPRWGHMTKAEQTEGEQKAMELVHVGILLSSLSCQGCRQAKQPRGTWSPRWKEPRATNHQGSWLRAAWLGTLAWVHQLSVHSTGRRWWDEAGDDQAQRSHELAAPLATPPVCGLRSALSTWVRSLVPDGFSVQTHQCLAKARSRAQARHDAAKKVIANTVSPIPVFPDLPWFDPTLPLSNIIVLSLLSNFPSSPNSHYYNYLKDTHPPTHTQHAPTFSLPVVVLQYTQCHQSHPSNDFRQHAQHWLSRMFHSMRLFLSVSFVYFHSSPLWGSEKSSFQNRSLGVHSPTNILRNPSIKYVFWEEDNTQEECDAFFLWLTSYARSMG